MATPIPKGEHVPTADHYVVMNGITWDGYETLLSVRGEQSSPRMAYLDGAVEIMASSWDHERIAGRIGSLLEAYTFELGIECCPYRRWTLKRQRMKAGVEADECYQFGPDQTERFPDLAIEVVWTHGGIDKLEIYRRLGVQEVWFWDDGAITIFHLARGRYVSRKRSSFVPALDLAEICKHIENPSLLEAKRALIAAIRRP